MNALVRILIFTILNLLLFYCTYDPKESNPTGAIPIEKPEHLNIDLNFSGDTVYYSSRIETNFKYEVKDNKVKTIVIFINDEQKAQYSSNSGSLNFSSYNFQLKKGAYNLRLDFYIKSGTGSLADRLGKENFLYSKEWTLIVTDDYDYNKLSIDTSGQKVILHWNRFKYPGFKSYDIYKSTKNILVHSIQNIDSMSWEDEKYAGLMNQYYIRINYDKEYIQTNSVRSDYDLPVINLSKASAFKNIVNWENNKFYDNIYGYYIFHRSNDENFKLIKHITNKDILTFEHEHLAFLAKSYYWVLPDTWDPTDDWIESLKDFQNHLGKSIGYGDNFLKFYKFSFHDLNNIYFNKSYKTYKCDSKTGEITDSSNIWGIFSNNAKYLINIRQDSKYYLDLYELETGILVKTLKMEDIVNKNISPSELVISDNGIILFRLYQDQEWVMYDMINEKVLFRKPIDYTTEFHISPDGKYFINDGGYSVNSVVYEYTNGGYKQIWSQFVAEIQFNPLSNNEIAYYTRDYNNHTVKIYNLENKNFSCNVFTENSEGQFIDFYNRRILVHNSDKAELQIFDYNGSLLLGIPSSKGYSSSDTFVLINKIIYSTTGLKINLEGYL